MKEKKNARVVKGYQIFKCQMTKYSRPRGIKYKASKTGYWEMYIDQSLF